MSADEAPPVLPHRHRRPGPGETRCASLGCGAIVPSGSVDRRGRCRRCQRIGASAKNRKRLRRSRARRRAAALLEADR